MRSIAVRVPREKCESIRKMLRDCLNTSLIPRRDEEFVYLPLKRKVNGLDMVEMDFEERKGKFSSYKDVLNIPEESKAFLPSSYDIVGDILLIKLPDQVLRYRREIGNALLKTHNNVKVVCLSKPVKGEYRTRNIEIIAGENRTETIHREYGLRFFVDVKEVFFSPRLAGERYRIAKLVKEKETVIDMFAGVAPFSIMIARFGSPRIVYAIDKNPRAIELARKNVVLNKVLDKVEILQGDAREVIKNLSSKADRIIMNLPFLAHNFFTDSLLIARDNCTIHYYDVLKEEEVEERIRVLEKKADYAHREIEIEQIRRIKTYAPREFYTCFDIRVN